MILVAAVLFLAVTVHSAPRCGLNQDLDCEENYNNGDHEIRENSRTAAPFMYKCENPRAEFWSQYAPDLDCLGINNDCDEIYKKHSTTASGVYTIYPTTPPAKVYCDMDTDGGRWTVLQRRVDGTVNFYRPWAEYRAGFGDASGEYWLGLENMHLLTKDKKCELRVDMEDFEGNTAFASYSSFSVGSEADGYKLQVAGFKNGGAGDSLTLSNGMKFTTFDKDQDTWAWGNCASRYYGACWCGTCHDANINGDYLWGQTAHDSGVVWYHWKGFHYSLKAVAMKIRRVPRCGLNQDLDCEENYNNGDHEIRENSRTAAPFMYKCENPRAEFWSQYDTDLDCEGINNDCDEIYKRHSTTASGVYTIYPTTPPAKVYCDMDTDGGRWTVLQRRVDGTVNFYRPWAEYRAGFGDASGEYWLGLENMHLLTKDKKCELRVDMEDFEGNTAFASYSSFSVGSEADGYKLQVAGFQDGGAGDSLTHSNGMEFSTFDKDQDTWAWGNCASRYYGAFWYRTCHKANINGDYLWGQTAHDSGVVWYHWKGYHYSLKAVAMKIRRVP